MAAVEVVPVTRQEAVRALVYDALSERLDGLERLLADVRRTVDEARRADHRGQRAAPADPDDLRSRRLALNLSQAEAARRAGISRSQVCDLERGRRAGVLTLPAYLAMLERAENSRLTDEI